jgi:L-fuculose-phosphate aldolase
MLTAEDICMVDLDGNQLAGSKKRTSEILLHLEIMKANPKARACVHAHPPHATAFAITDACVPSCMIPEMEVLVGRVGRTPYETPGTKAFAETVLPVCQDHNTILLQNHGVITWADDLERAYWFMEIVDAYCRTVVIASHIGGQMTYMPPEKVGDLLKIKQTLGLPDARYNLKPADYCACEFRPGAVGGTTAQQSTAAAEGQAGTPETEALVQLVTDEVMRALAR